MSDGFDLRDYQTEAVESVFRHWDNGIRSTMVVLPTGCHARGQKIRMFDGTVKAVEDIVVGDALAGPNLAPRRVLQLVRGVDEMFDVIPNSGKPWRVNGDHLLSFKAHGEDVFCDVYVRTYLWFRSIHAKNLSDGKPDSLIRIGSDGEQRVSFDVVPSGTTEEYFGFTVDGDHRYLIDDFTVVHNCGKTVVASSIAEQLWERHHTRDDAYNGAILFLAHREELITQTHQKFRKHIPDAKIAIEMAEYRAYGQLHRKPEIVIASTSSMLSRYKKYPKDYFGAAFVDECHHSVGKSYTEPLAHFNDNLQFLLGLTATPKRHDGKAMGRIFDDVAFKMTLLQGIDRGWILEPRFQRINVSEMNLQNVSVVAGDFSKSSLSKEMSRETVLGRMVSETIERAGGRQTAIYCVDVDHMRAVEQQLKQRGQTCGLIDGKTPGPVRKAKLRDFRERAIQFIISCGTLTEGWDCPECEVIAMFRPTQSESLYEQIVGRGLRPLWPPTEDTPELRRAAIAASEKPYCIVLDFVGNSRHKLANLGDILGGTFDDEVKRLAMDLARHETGPVDMRELLKRAEQILDEQRAKRFQKGQAREKLTRALWNLVPHPYDVLDLDRQHAEKSVSRDDAYGRAPIDAAITLEQFKLEQHEIKRLTNKEQVMLARVIVARARRGMCTWKQAKLLHRFGYDANMPVVAAAKVLDEIKANEWWRPYADGVNPRLIEIAQQPENRWLKQYVDEEIQRHEKLNNVLPFV